MDFRKLYIIPLVLTDNLNWPIPMPNNTFFFREHQLKHSGWPVGVYWEDNANVGWYCNGGLGFAHSPNSFSIPSPSMEIFGGFAPKTSGNPCVLHQHCSRESSRTTMTNRGTLQSVFIETRFQVIYINEIKCRDWTSRLLSPARNANADNKAGTRHDFSASLCSQPWSQWTRIGYLEIRNDGD